MADALEVSLDYLVGEGINSKFDKMTLKRIEEIEHLDVDKKKTLFDVIDTFIRESKGRKAFAWQINAATLQNKKQEQHRVTNTRERGSNFLTKYKMETVLVQINNNKAYRLLEDLEALHIIKVLKKSIQPQQKLSEKYAGKLPSDIADELQNYVTQSRNEWNNRSI